MELKLKKIQLKRFQAKTKQDSLALDQQEAELYSTNQALQAYIDRENAKRENIRIMVEESKRRNNLEYSGISLGLLVLFVVISFVGKAKPPMWLIGLSVFLPFLILFEFLLVLTDPFFEFWTEDEPINKLLVNTFLAALIYPAHSFFEGKLKKRIMTDVNH